MKTYMFRYLMAGLFAVTTIFPINGTTNPVGTPRGSFGVSGMGGATYTIDIDLPNVNTSLMPQLSISYNSQGGNGIVGWGCNISGISSITRGLKDYYHDGEAKGISHNAADAYYLDGKRLILESGVEGTSGAVYRIEGDPVSTATVQSWANGICFIVHTSDGLDYEYGKSISSRQDYYSSISNAMKINTWYVNKITNAIGDDINFSYNLNLDYLYRYPETITYRNNYNALMGTISLDYESRDDIQDFYLEDVKGTVSYRLKTITSGIGDSIFRSYDFVYNTTSDASGKKFSRLVQVTEKKGNEESLNPITFSWNYLPSWEQTATSPSVPIPESSTLLDIRERYFVTGDINNDGLTDIVQVSPVFQYLYNYSPQNYSGNDYTYAYVFLASKSNGAISYESPIQYVYNPEFKLGSDWSSTNSPSVIADLTGDGFGDLVLPATTIINGWGGTKEFQLRYIPGNKIAHNQFSSTQVISIRLYDTNTPPLYLTEDFNRDGKCDLITLEKDGTGNAYHYHLVYDVLSPLGHSGTLSVSSAPKKMFSGDFNGDGMMDIIVFHSGGHKIFWNQGGSLSNNPFSDSSSTIATNVTDADHIYQGDFNGDGLPDFLLNDENDANYYFALNTGNGTFSKSLACQLDITDQSTDEDDDRFTFLIYDLNHDGRSDAVFVKSNYKHHGGVDPHDSYKDTSVRWLVSTGTSLQVVRTLTYTGGEDDARGYNLLLGDFTGNGEVELMNYGQDLYTGGMAPTMASMSGDSPAAFHYLSNVSDSLTRDSIEQAQGIESGEESDPLTTRSSSSGDFHLYRCSGMTLSSGKVTAITDGMGNSVNITYNTLTDEDIYTKGTGDNYPVMDINPALHVVSTATIGNGAAGSTVNSYRYGGLKAHVKGRGLMGFSTTTTVNQTTNIESTHEVYFDTLFYIPQRTIAITTADNLTSTTETLITAVSKQNGKNYYAYPSTKTETDWYNNTVTTSYIYDTTNCFPLTETTTWSSSMYKQTQYGNYTLSGGRYQPGTITHTQKHEDDAQPFSITKTITYNSYGLPVSVCEASNTSLALTHTYAYNSSGHLLSESISGSGVSTLTTYYTYNIYQQVTQSYTSPASTSHAYTYDIWGNVVTDTDNTDTSSPLTTTNVYDKWGHLIESTSPLGIVTTISWEWGNTNGKKYKIVESEQYSPALTTWYDSKGRKVEESSIGEGGVSIGTLYSYNNTGLLSYENSHKGNLSTYAYYQYDALGRVKSESTSLYSATYSYGNKSMTMNRDGRSYYKTYDDWGNILTSTDPAGSIAYSYSSNGHPLSITNVDGHAVTLTYDAVGNRISLSDPDAGTSLYSYDAVGRIVSQTDARGCSISNVYDSWGRLSSCTTSGETISYAYDSWGRLTSMQNSDASLTYVYDQYGRKTQETRTITGGSPVNIYYSYNSTTGLLSTIQFPGSVYGIYTYDSNGYLNHYLINGASLWQLYSENGTSTVSHLFGSSMSKTESRNYKGQYTGITVQQGSSTKHQMTFGYTGATGNLSSRTGMLGATESFSYDNLDRLTNVSVGGTESAYVQYGNNGNIIRKTGLGQLYYNNTKPHAIEEVDNSEGIIPSSLQEVTYNAFGKVEHIEDGDYEMDFVYGPDQERWQTVLKQNGQVVRTILYAGDYECITEGNTVRQFYYGENGVICMKQSGQNNVYYHACTDNLGSIIKLIGSNGNSVFEATYDAWGRQTVTKNDIGFHRGYTGHEMLPEFGLINMNGRLYDPILGRFLSPDNYVQEPTNSQNFNRYSYCLNNPLKFTDPSGEIWWMPIAIGAAVGAYTGASIHSNNAAFWKWTSDSWKGAITGAYIGASIGSCFSSVLFPSEIVANPENGLMTKNWSIVTSIIDGGTSEIITNLCLEGSWDNSWKAGIMGSLSAAWSVTNGLGIIHAFGNSSIGQLFGKVLYQMLGTFNRSVGDNWVKGDDLFSKMVLGVGPVNITLGKGEKPLQLGNNIENIMLNGLGIANLLIGGKMEFVSKDLTFLYSGGKIADYFFDPRAESSGFGIGGVFGNSNLKTENFPNELISRLYKHEILHLWQSRSMLNMFIPNYLLQGLKSLLFKGGNFIRKYNVYESQAYGYNPFMQ